jgi:hypothetical protein
MSQPGSSRFSSVTTSRHTCLSRPAVWSSVIQEGRGGAPDRLRRPPGLRGVVRADGGVVSPPGLPLKGRGGAGSSGGYPGEQVAGLRRQAGKGPGGLRTLGNPVRPLALAVAPQLGCCAIPALLPPASR